MPTGNLSFILRTARDALPINNGSVTVTDEAGNTVFYEFLTAGSSGLSRTATLETPPKSLSLDSGDTARPYSVYNVLIRADGNYRMQIIGVQMFEGTTTRLPVELVPLPEGVVSPDAVEIIIIRIPEHILRQTTPVPTPPPTLAPSFKEALPAVNIGEGVYIPETVTVHLGTPEQEAQNVTLGFSDYIKNVASSEIYPTWPREALEANIIAQISLTLNRIYTEWYRSQGYPFDITSSTAFDQAFVYGRNIFDEISVIVDEIFNTYLVRPNSVEPLFASYCNGTTTTCAGLSQWGTVALAEGGQQSKEILGFYYGDIIITETDDIRTPEESYPGVPLSAGSTGEDVRIIQEQLNRISINFPQLPLTEVNSVYDESTAETVREFQRLFILPINGTVDKATWYRISQIYASVKRLAQLTSEGQRAAYNQQLYPGTPIKLNSRGSEVQEIQFYLQRISRFNPAVESPVLDGIFGTDTQRAVISFQNAYGAEPTGVIDEAVWALLVEVYNGTLDNVEEPEPSANVVPYPGYVVSAGSRGEYPAYIQRTLNVINDVFLIIPELEEDGIFGTQTQQAVNAFASLFGLLQNAGINETLWNKINQIYLAVTAQCIFESGSGEGTLPYPQTALGIGSSGDSVIYVQEKINVISTAIPYVGFLEVDGRYGSATAASVSALQRIFGLTETGRVNESGWLLINYVYTAVINGCLPRNEASPAFSEKPKNEVPETSIGVGELKELMRKNGINTGNGPLFGLKSRRALAQWQNENGLEPTGLPDAATRLLLKQRKK
ncbi:MAG: peptidoglycan-binding protein [Clostridia bacterium]|nr:peptidoglycan-binding protein [Clostridia bacterium]